MRHQRKKVVTRKRLTICKLLFSPFSVPNDLLANSLQQCTKAHHPVHSTSYWEWWVGRKIPSDDCALYVSYRVTRKTVLLDMFYVTLVRTMQTVTH